MIDKSDLRAVWDCVVPFIPPLLGAYIMPGLLTLGTDGRLAAGIIRKSLDAVHMAALYQPLRACITAVGVA